MECSICREKINRLDSVVELPCLHKFHKNCIYRWFDSHTTCPMCRYDVRNMTSELLKIFLGLVVYQNLILRVVPYMYIRDREMSRENIIEDRSWFSKLKDKFYNLINFFKF